MNPRLIAGIMAIMFTVLGLPAACLGLTAVFYDDPRNPRSQTDPTPTPEPNFREIRLPSECTVSRMAETDTQNAMAVVEEVIDGDTVRLANRTENVRLWGIDAPELNQPGGLQAKRRLEEFIPPGELLRMEVMPDLDPYGQLVAVIGSEEGPAANHQMVQSGWAFYYKAYAPDNPCLLNAELYARQNHAGLWRQYENGGIRPWEWRRGASRE